MMFGLFRTSPLNGPIRSFPRRTADAGLSHAGVSPMFQ